MRVLIVTILLLPAIFCFAQKNSSIEITPLVRYDNYGTFINRYGNSIDTAYLTLKGTSWGITGQYKLKLFNKWQGKIGIGYYKYVFSKIKNVRFGVSNNSRSFDYPSPDYVVFATNKYYYNSINFNIGIEKIIPFKHNYELIVGFNFINDFTYSQKFYLPVDPTIDPPYKRNDFKYFGFSSTINLGVNKNIKKFYIGPHFLLPIFDNWKLDKIFRENPNDSRHKWFNGYGGEIVFGYYLKH